MMFHRCVQLIHVLLDKQSCAHQEASFETVHLLVYHLSKQLPKCRDMEHTKFHLIVLCSFLINYACYISRLEICPL
jgi:hypothetical protein